MTIGEREIAALGRDNTVGDGEAQAGTAHASVTTRAVPAGVETLKGSLGEFELIGGDAWAVIGDFDFDPVGLDG